MLFNNNKLRTLTCSIIIIIGFFGGLSDAEEGAYRISLNKTVIKDVKKLSNCKAELDDGSIIDLSSLDNAKSPRNDRNGDYIYSYNPCTPIKCGSESVGVCQSSADGSVTYNLGSQDSVKFTLTSGSLYMQFSQAPKTTNMQCKCGDSESFNFVRENPSNTYTMIFQSPCCCPNKCKGKKPSGGGSSGGLSVGSILLIIFFAVLAAYLIIGILIMKFHKRASGIELIPNVQTWTTVYGDVKNGVSFTVSKVRGKSGYSNI